MLATDNGTFLYMYSYPHALHHLELLQHAQFRSEMKKDEWREYLNQKQFDHWRTWLVIPPHFPYFILLFLTYRQA